MRTAIRVSGWLALVFLVAHWGYSGIVKPWLDYNTRVEAKLRSEVVDSAAFRLELKAMIAKADQGDYDPHRYFMDMDRLEYAGPRLKEKGESWSEQIGATRQLLHAKMRMHYTQDQMAGARKSYDAAYHPERHKGDWGGMLLFFLKLYLAAFPALLLYLLLRVTEGGGGLAWGLASLWENFAETLVTLLFWPMAVWYFHPHKPLPERIAAVSRGLQKLSSPMPRFNQARGLPVQLPRLEWDALSSLSRWQAVGVILRLIWHTGYGFRCLFPGILRQPFQAIYYLPAAVYLTLVATVALLLGEVQLVQAQAPTRKEEAPLLKGVLWVYTHNLRSTGPPNEAIFLFFRNETDLVFLNYGQSLTMEVAHRPLTLGQGSSTFKVGPYLHYDAASGQLARGGLNGFFNWKPTKNLQVAGPVYLTYDGGKSRFSFLAPNIMVTHKVTDKFRLGLGGYVNLVQGQKPAVLLGLLAQYKPTPEATLRFRLGQWLSGTLQGDVGLRAELGFSF